MTASILVVDDNIQNVKLLEAKLLAEYYNVFTAYDGFSALEILKTNKIDVVLLDVMMPNIDGFETCIRIKSNPKTLHIPVIMITALSYEDRVKGLEAGADEFLSKPINDHALMARVRSLTRMKQIYDELLIRSESHVSVDIDNIVTLDDFSFSKILIITDDNIESDNIKSHMSALTDSIYVINNYSGIIEIMNFSPDLVIISLNIDGVDPLRLLVDIKMIDELRYSNIIFLAEENDIDIVLKALELGANDYCTYPVDKNEIIARVKTQLRRKKYQDELRKTIDQNLTFSIRDSLTNVFNRRYFESYIKQVLDSNKGKNFCLLMLDIDDFKHINDNYGHLAGDEVLKLYAKILFNNIRINDFVCRYGGEEFIVTLRDISTEESLKIAERIREEVEKTKCIINQDISLNITTSVGVAFFETNMTIQDLISNADIALYKAKTTGKNKVILF